MVPDQASRTAEYMAFFRALESARPPSERLFFDPYALYFLRPRLRRAVRLSRVPVLGTLLYWHIDFRARGARTSAIARTCLTDDAWRQALRDGLRQIVILGAGFDCRSYRITESSSAMIFEVDHPMTLYAKRRRLSHVMPVTPRYVRYVDIDFNQQSLPVALAEAGFDPSSTALFLWEGVTHYLTPEAVDSTLRYVGTQPPGSRVVFTYVDRGVLDGSVHFEGATELMRHVAQLGEPWTFGFCPREVPAFLRERGLELDRDAGAREYRAQYLGPVGGKAKGYEFYHAVVAHVPEKGSQPSASNPAEPGESPDAQS